MTSTGHVTTDVVAHERRGHRVRLLLAGTEAPPAPLMTVRQWAADANLACEYAPDLPRAVRALTTSTWDAVVVVLGERAEDELAWWMDTLRSALGRPHLIAIADHPSMGLVLRAERLGVQELLPLPLHREAFTRAVTRLHAAADEVAIPLPAAEAAGQYALVGLSPAMLEVFKAIAQVAPSISTVLLQGESGTGKEVVARAIHEHGPRVKGPFVAVNCAAIPENKFREDLYYRLAVMTIRLPRLRERGEDLLLLVAHFVHLFSARAGKAISNISDRALELLREHEWVGNVRELRNVMERAVVVASGDTLRAEHLADEIRGAHPDLPDRNTGAILTLAEAEARHIARVLAHTDGQIGAAAELLGIHRNTLARKIKEYGL